jgi:hypothetical protein
MGFYPFQKSKQKKADSPGEGSRKNNFHFRIPDSGYLRPHLNRKILQIILLFLWFRSIGAAKSFRQLCEGFFARALIVNSEKRPNLARIKQIPTNLG